MELNMPSFRHKKPSEWQEEQPTQSLWFQSEIDLDQLIHNLRFLGTDGLVNFIMRLEELLGKEDFTRKLSDKLYAKVALWDSEEIITELVRNDLVGKNNEDLI